MTTLLILLLVFWLGVSLAVYLIRKRRATDPTPSAVARARGTARTGEVPHPSARLSPPPAGDEVVDDEAEDTAERGTAERDTAQTETAQREPGESDGSADRPLMDLLAGIELPFDLTPVPSAVEDPERHLIFITTHSSAEEVGTRFVDELGRIGFTFEPMGLDQGIAVRGDETISMTIVPGACQVQGADGPRYRAANPGDVALELWVGRSPSPPVVSDQVVKG